MTGRPSAEHTCAHPACTTVLPSAIFACPPHWRSLPRTLKNAVNVAWRDILSPGGMARHDMARADAVDYWEAHRR